MDFEEKTLASEYVYKGRILNLRKDEIALSDGARSVREIVEHKRRQNSARKTIPIRLYKSDMGDTRGQDKQRRRSERNRRPRA